MKSSLVTILFAFTSGDAGCRSNSRRRLISVNTRNLIPRHLLSLVHAPEVHKELDLTDEQVTAWKIALGN